MADCCASTSSGIQDRVSVQKSTTVLESRLQWLSIDAKVKGSAQMEGWMLSYGETNIFMLILPDCILNIDQSVTFVVLPFQRVGFHALILHALFSFHLASLNSMR